MPFVSATAQAPLADRKPNPDLLTADWKARWICCPDSSPFDYGVYLFRHAFELKTPPSSFLIHVSGDNRYQLFVNGRRVVWGPARGDILHWRYETVDVARYLVMGRNVLAAVVWNEGELAAVAQLSDRTSFIAQGDLEAEHSVNTGRNWKVIACPAYRPIEIRMADVRGYFALGPCEEFDGVKYPWGWEQPQFDDSSWRQAAEIGPGAPRDGFRSPNHKLLVPRTIPLMEETPQRIPKLRRAEGAKASANFPGLPSPFIIQAQTKAKLLLDQTYLTCAYPELMVSGGRGTKITLRYAEALWTRNTRRKDNRDEVDGKDFFGSRDVFVTDGVSRRLYQPLFWRTYRYLELTVETQEEPITIEDIQSVYTGYPWKRLARFESDDPDLPKMLEIGWRTARLCSHESYMDCPYYEQLQYTGDTRIQGLISVYETGDTRLYRNAIEQIASSRTAEGLTYSRAPSDLHQYIPPFCLWWIGMLQDYWLYVPDPEFVREMLPVMRGILSFYERFERADGTLQAMPWWNFVDWVKQWPQGTPPPGPDGLAAPVNFQLLLAWKWAARLEAALGKKPLSAEYNAKAVKLAATLEKKYWSTEKGLYADTTEKKTFSQHTSTLAVLAGMAGPRAQAVLNKVLSEPGLAPASIYFTYYLHEAMRFAGLGNRYLEQLGVWRNLLKLGVTTWPEQGGPEGRSECHAWSASPNVAVFRTVLGIDSAAPGFGKVHVSPNLGKLQRAAGVIPHPKGEISAKYERTGARLKVSIELPKDVTGTFRFRGVIRPLVSGANVFTAGG